jgi:hypothetical protein
MMARFLAAASEMAKAAMFQTPRGGAPESDCRHEGEHNDDE